MFELLRDLPKVYNLPLSFAAAWPWVNIPKVYIPKVNIPKVNIPKVNIQKNIKCIQYETVDFVPQVFNYLPIIIKPTDYKIPNVPYKEQYENRDC